MDDREPVERSDALDFAGLRAEVEAAAKVPDFTAVARRARRRRLIGRWVGGAAVVAVVGVLGSTAIYADGQRTDRQGPVSGPDAGLPTYGLPSAAPDSTGNPAVQVTVQQVAGVDLDHVYALVDVCVAESCDLQVSRLASGKAAPTAPVRAHLLRPTPQSLLDDVSLVALSPTSLQVSGVPSNGVRQYARIDLSTVDSPPTGATPAATPGDRTVQLTENGPILAVSRQNGAILTLHHQPQLIRPTLVTGLAPARGSWVTGTAPGTGELAVAVSRDAGRTWTTQSLGVPAPADPAADPVVLASYDGTRGYLLTRLADGSFAFFCTANGGRTWLHRSTTLPWPQPVAAGSAYGLLVRSDGSMLAWLAGSPTVTYLESTDGGASFTVVPAGPSGPAYPLPDGYVSTGAQPAISRDAATWVRATFAYEVPGG